MEKNWYKKSKKRENLQLKTNSFQVSYEESKNLSWHAVIWQFFTKKLIGTPPSGRFQALFRCKTLINIGLKNIFIKFIGFSTHARSLKMAPKSKMTLQNNKILFLLPNS
jgi:hypothetical protein